MKYLKYFESKTDIDAICKKYGIENYTINSDGTVDVYDSVDIEDLRITKLPLKFGYVSGGFDCGNNGLTSLEGAPKEVGGYFDCSRNDLTTLLGAPRKVGRDFDCYYNQLTSLVGAPIEVVGGFDCRNNQLTSLVGAPEEVGGDFDCNRNPLPREILDNYKYIEKIVKYQYDYNIWRRDGSLDKYRFSDMMKEILEEETNI